MKSLKFRNLPQNSFVFADGLHRQFEFPVTSSMLRSVLMSISKQSQSKTFKNSVFSLLHLNNSEHFLKFKFKEVPNKKKIVHHLCENIQLTFNLTHESVAAFVYCDETNRFLKIEL